MTGAEATLTAGAIRQMPAGPEFDALVGRAFPDLVKGGWCVCGVALSGAWCQRGPKSSDAWTLQEAEARCAEMSGRERGWEDARWFVAPWLFSPSTEIEVALSVLCKARGPGGWFQIAGEGDLYHCRLSRASRYELDGSQSLGSGETISLAICRAALVKQSEAP